MVRDHVRAAMGAITAVAALVVTRNWLSAGLAGQLGLAK